MLHHCETFHIEQRLAVLPCVTTVLLLRRTSLLCITSTISRCCSTLHYCATCMSMTSMFSLPAQVFRLNISHWTLSHCVATLCIEHYLAALPCFTIVQHACLQCKCIHFKFLLKFSIFTQNVSCWTILRKYSHQSINTLLPCHARQLYMWNAHVHCFTLFTVMLNI